MDKILFYKKSHTHTLLEKENQKQTVFGPKPK